MHESVSVDNLSKCTRPWFEWANAMLVVFVENALGMDCAAAAEKHRLASIQVRDSKDYQPDTCTNRAPGAMSSLPVTTQQQLPLKCTAMSGRNGRRNQTLRANSGRTTMRRKTRCSLRPWRPASGTPGWTRAGALCIACGARHPYMLQYTLSNCAPISGHKAWSRHLAQLWDCYYLPAHACATCALIRLAEATS